MIARVTGSQLPPSKLEDLNRLIEPGFDAVRQLHGFKNLLLLRDRATGKLLMVTLWETEADMRASDSLRQQLIAQLGPLGLGDISTDVYDTVTQV